MLTVNQPVLHSNGSPVAPATVSLPTVVPAKMAGEGFLGNEIKHERDGKDVKPHEIIHTGHDFTSDLVQTTNTVFPNAILGTQIDPSHFQSRGSSSLALSDNKRNSGAGMTLTPTAVLGYRTVEEMKAYQQTAFDHMSGKDSHADLCDPMNSYDSKAIEIYTYSSPKLHPCICFVSKPQDAFPKELPPEHTSFHAQLQQFVILRNKLNKPAAYFIAERPGTRQHFIFGAFFGSDLFIMDPRGRSPDTALSAALLKVKRDFALVNIYFSNTVIQADDVIGHAASGLICVEFMRRCKSLPFRIVEESFSAMKATTHHEAKTVRLMDLSDAHFQSVDITKNRLMPSFLMRFVGTSAPSDYAANSKSLRIMQRDELHQGRFDDMTEQGVMSRLIISGDLAANLDRDLQFLQLRDRLKTAGRRMISSAHIETSSPEESPQSSGVSTPSSSRTSLTRDNTVDGLVASNSISSLDTRSRSNLLASASFPRVSSQESVISEGPELITRTSGGSRLQRSSSSAMLFHSPTMAQNYWARRYLVPVTALITSPDPSSEIVKLFLGPKFYFINQQHKQATQERELTHQRLQDERDFYGRLHKTVCQFEERMHNVEILKQYEQKVINPDENKAESYDIQITAGKILTATQQEELKQCRMRIADYDAILAQHQRASVEHSESFASHYHKIMNESFKEDKDSKQEGRDLTFQAQINAYAMHPRVTYRAPSLTIHADNVTKLQMQLQHDVAEDVFLSNLLVVYGERLERNIQRLLIEKATDLPLDVLREYKREYPLEIHEDYLNELSADFFQNKRRGSILQTFTKSRNLTKLKRDLHEKWTHLKTQVANAEAEQEKLDLIYSQGLAAAQDDYRQAAEIRMTIERDTVLGYLSRSIEGCRRWAAHTLCEDVMSTGIPTFPLRRIKEPTTGNGLLHILARAYLQAGPLARVELRKIFEELLQRGCDLLAVNNARQTPFTFANSLLPLPLDESRILPDWELLKIAFKHHPTSSEGQKQIKNVLLKYFDTRQSFFRKYLSFFYNQRISEVTRRYQMTMALEALVSAVKKLKDDPLQEMITKIDAMEIRQGRLIKSLRKAGAALSSLVAHSDANASSVYVGGIRGETIASTIRSQAFSFTVSPEENKEILSTDIVQVETDALEHRAAETKARQTESDRRAADAERAREADAKKAADAEREREAEAKKRADAERREKEKDDELAKFRAEKAAREARKAARANQKLVKAKEEKPAFSETSISAAEGKCTDAEAAGRDSTPSSEPIPELTSTNAVPGRSLTSSSLTNITASLSSLRVTDNASSTSSVTSSAALPNPSGKRAFVPTIAAAVANQSTLGLFVTPTLEAHQKSPKSFLNWLFPTPSINVSEEAPLLQEQETVNAISSNPAAK